MREGVFWRGEVSGIVERIVLTTSGVIKYMGKAWR